jgi:hypothetical protein
MRCMRELATNVGMHAIWGAVAGAIATLILGFHFGVCHPANSADQLANERSGKQVIAALAPFCADRFRKSADAAQAAELLAFTTDYERGSFLEKGGWISLPGSTETNWAVGRACGNLLAAAAKK